MVSNRRTQNIILFLAGSILAFLAAEFYLRLNPPVQVYMATRNVVQQTHSEESTNPFISYIPRAGLMKPFRNKEFNVMVNINSTNMRGREYSFEKPAGIKRIAAVGDSFVFGWGVENEEVFTQILEKHRLNNTEVLNFGVSGYGAYQQLERLKEESLRFHPDIVLFCLYGFPEGYPEIPLEPFAVREARLRSADHDMTLKERALSCLGKKSHLFLLFQLVRVAVQIRKENIFQKSGADSADVQNGLRVLQDLKSLGIQHHFTPVVVYVPTKELARIGRDSTADFIAKFCLKENILFLNLTKPLSDFWRSTGKSPYFRIDDHWNHLGHETTALTLARELKKKTLLPAESFQNFSK